MPGLSGLSNQSCERSFRLPLGSLAPDFPAPFPPAIDFTPEILVQLECYLGW